MLPGVSSARLFGLASGLCLLLGALALGGVRIARLAASELEHEGPRASIADLRGAPGSTRISARLTTVALEAGEQATFEVCANGDLSRPAFENGVDFVVWREVEQKLELKVGLDAAHRKLVKRDAAGSCLTLGGGTVARSTRYALDAVWAGHTLPAELAGLPLRARVLARHPLGFRDGLLVVCAALGAVLCLLGAFTPGASARSAPRPLLSPARSFGFALGFSALGALLFALALRLPLAFSVGPLVRGLFIAGAEATLAFLGARVVFEQRQRGLSLFAPERRAGAWLFVACGGALLLRIGSHWALSLVPRTGVAPIETFIAWPSGALTFALLGMAVPLAEELFFRGFVYGALSSLGRAAAISGTLLMFVAAHAQQVWGNWGALVSLLLTSTVLTALRAASGSTLVPALAHVLFNLSLWRDSFGG